MNTALFCLWIIYELICIFVFWYLYKKEIVRKNEDKSFEVSCETCNNRRNVTYGEINVSYKIKKQNATADEIIGDISGVGNGEIVQYSKKCYCERCDKITWNKIEGYSDILKINRKIKLRYAFWGLIYCVCVPVVVSLLFYGVYSIAMFLYLLFTGQGSF